MTLADPQWIGNVYKLIDEQRPKFLEDFADQFVSTGPRMDAFLYAGYRFKENQTVLLRILSATTCEGFDKNPVGWVRAALSDCASADHWYQFEKQWD